MTLSLAEIERGEELERKASTGPWRSNTRDTFGDDWPIGSIIDLGEAENDKGTYSNYIVTTDRVRASQMGGDAKSDAEFIAFARNHARALLSAAREVERTRLSNFDPGSSNGRTTDFESVNRGSSPRPGATHPKPEDTPSNTGGENEKNAG